MKKFYTTMLILLVYLTSFSQTPTQERFDYQFNSKYGITTLIQGPDAAIGISVPLSNVFSIIPTVGFKYELNSDIHNETYGLAVQINMGNGKLVPYGIIRGEYSTVDYGIFGIGYGGEYYFLPRVSVNIELQVNMTGEVISTGTALGATFYFGE